MRFAQHGGGRPARHRVDFHEDVRIPSSVPGLTLGGDLYLPETVHRVPALVTLHTGRKDGIGGLAARRYLRYFAERGYAVLYVDCFGIGGSEGVPRPILSPGEVDDGVAVVEWAAAQPWCTGSVGMWGLSHGGMTTLAVASRRPAPLRAIFPVMGWTDAERDLVHPAGLRGGIGMFGHLSLYNIFCSLLPPIRAHDREKYETLWKERLERFEPWFVDSWRHPPGHEVWTRRRFDPGRINVPAFCVAGWRDLFCDSMIDAYQRIDAPKRLLVGPWLHSFPDASAVEPVPSIAMACRWWDTWLHGEPSRREPAESVTVFLQGPAGGWMRSARWPPTGNTEQVFAAAGPGRLLRSCPAGAAPSVATVSREGDPTVGALSGLTKHPIDKFGYPLDQHEDDSRALSFTGSALPRSAVLAGRPEVNLVLDPGTTAARCVVKLTDVDPEGRSMLVSMGAVDLGEFPPDDPAAPRVVPVRLDPTFYRLAAGHRIRLVLAESDVPRHWPAAPGRLVVRVARAFGDLTGPAGNAVTTVRLPVCAPDTFHEVVMPASRKPGSRADAGENRWELARDELTGSMRMSLAKQDRVDQIDGARGSLTMATRIDFGVSEHDAAGARMTASGVKTVRTTDGDHVAVRAAIEMNDADATVRAEVLLNGNPFFSREWKLN
ncbi:CocE/NonD family hydrolase [Amycolatopsis sp. YIM 10]|uniref:CocE/NonD family hydrolase n=1 Tax=Amycolatopsis sp. YIM 10 TaxID=2653857 RepID=UPI0012A924EE|nr:CocE/NonD family hydrolase [Amycolatopsis sp. YIM 10]QFU91730.1 Cocaine esterase [Amycolatopsis sp. YIM 10]